MVKDLRTIIGIAPIPATRPLSPPFNPNHPFVKADEKEWADTQLKGATAVPDPTGNDNRSEKVKKDKTLKPGGGTKVGLGEAHGVFMKGGSIGSKHDPDKPIKIHDTEEAAHDHAKRMNKLLSPGEKQYYKIKYHVKSIKEESEELEEATHKVHINYDDPSGKGIASIHVPVRANDSEHAKQKAMKRITQWPHPISGYKNAKVKRVVKVNEESEEGENDENEKNERRERWARRKKKRFDRRDVDENVEQVDELDRKTLKSYQRKAGTAAQRAWNKGDKEEDKSMSTDGYKYPEKQARHQANANVQHKIWAKRDRGLKMVDRRLNKEDIEQVDEISGKTLGSYVQKARVDAEKKRVYNQKLDNHPTVKKYSDERSALYADKRYDSHGRSKNRNKIHSTYEKQAKAKAKIDPNYKKNTAFGKRYNEIEKAVKKLHTGKLTD